MSSGSPSPSESSEEIVCVRVPCRDAKHRIGQAIELLKKVQRQKSVPPASRPLPVTAETPSRQVARA